MNNKIKQRNKKILNKVWDNTKQVFGETKRAVKETYNEGKKAVDYYGPRVNSRVGRVASNVQDLFEVKTSPDSVARDIQRSFQPPRDNGRYVDLTKPKRRSSNNDGVRKRGKVDWNNLGVDI